MTDLFNSNLDWISNLIGLNELLPNNRFILFKDSINGPSSQENILNKNDLLAKVSQYNGNFRLSITSSEFPIDSENRKEENATKLDNILIDIDFDNNIRTNEERKEIFENIINPLDLELNKNNLYPYYHYSGNKGLHLIIPVRLIAHENNKSNIKDTINRFRKYIIQKYLNNGLSEKYNIAIDNVNPFTAIIPIPYTIHPKTNNLTKPLNKFSDGYDHFLGKEIYMENWKAIIKIADRIPKIDESNFESIDISKINPIENPESYKDTLLELIRPYYVSGQRHNLTYAISGLLRRSGFNERFVNELFNNFVDKDNKRESYYTIRDVFKSDKLPGFPTLKEKIKNSEKLISELSDLLFPKKNDSELFEFNIDETHTVKLNLINKVFYKSVYKKIDKENFGWVDSLLFNIDFIPLKAVFYNDNYLIKYNYQNEELIENIETCSKKIQKDYALTNTDIKYFIIFLHKFIEYCILNKLLEYKKDIIYLENNEIIKSDLDNYKSIDLKKNLLELNEAYKITTNQKAFSITFCYSLMSLLSYFFRLNYKIFPFLIQYGLFQSGKTSLSLLFLKDGLDQLENESKLISNDVASIFTLSHELSKGFLPVCVDDIDPKFFEKYSTDLKGAAASPNLATRGKPNLDVKKYPFVRNPIFTVNQQLNLESASSIRSIVINWDQTHKDNQNIKNWFSLSFDKGFLLRIFDEIFTDTSINDIFKYLQEIKESKQYNQSIIDFSYDRIKELYSKYNIDCEIEKPTLDENNDSDSDELLRDELLEQWEYITKAKAQDGNPYKDYYFRPYLSKENLDVRFKDKEIKIYLSRPGFTLWLKRNPNPYWRTINDFINNNRLDPKPELKSHKFDSNSPRTCILIKINDKEKLSTYGLE